MVSYVAAVVIVVVVIRGILYVIQQNKSGALRSQIDRAGWGRYLACLVSGILFTNAVPHFFHGVSGETFPAPLGHLLGPGLPSNAANVVWGVVNLVLGYNMFVLGRLASQGKLGKVFFFAGVLIMGLFLASVFSNGGR